MPRRSDGPCCHAWPLRSLFCLQLLCFASPTPHMPSSGFRSRNPLLNMTFSHAASARCSVCLSLAIEEARWGAAHCKAQPAPLQTSSSAAHPKSHLSTAPARSRSSLHPQRPPQEISTTLVFAYGCPLFAYHVQSLAGAWSPLAASPLSHHLNQTSGGEEVVYFTFKHSVMGDICHRTCRLVKIQGFSRKMSNRKALKRSSPFPFTSFLQGPGRIFIVQLRS